MKYTIARDVGFSVRRLIERATGWKVERLGDGAFAVIDSRRRADAWFSYQSQVSSLITRLQIDLIVDVGANEGQFAREVRSFYSGPILSFEPVAASFAVLARAAANDPSWHVRQCALGSQAAEQTMHVAADTAFSSLLPSNDYCRQQFGVESQGQATELVTVRRIDDVLREEGITARRILLKMDTQGYDTQVFAGLGDRLDAVAALLSEVSLIPIYEGMPHWTDSIALYERAGFGVAACFPVTRALGRVIEYDCLLIKNSL